MNLLFVDAGGTYGSGTYDSGTAANNQTNSQAIKKCIDDFHKTNVGWAVGKMSLLSLVPGYNGNMWVNFAEWTVLPAAKVGIGKVLSESSAITTSGEVAGATLPETVASVGMTLLEKIAPPAIGLATMTDAAVGQGCAMMNDPNLMQAVENYY